MCVCTFVRVYAHACVYVCVRMDFIKTKCSKFILHHVFINRSKNVLVF